MTDWTEAKKRAQEYVTSGDIETPANRMAREVIALVDRAKELEEERDRLKAEVEARRSQQNALENCVAIANSERDRLKAEVGHLRFELEKRGCFECPSKEKRIAALESCLREVEEWLDDLDLSGIVDEWNALDQPRAAGYHMLRAKARELLGENDG